MAHIPAQPKSVTMGAEGNSKVQRGNSTLEARRGPRGAGNGEGPHRAACAGTTQLLPSHTLPAPPAGALPVPRRVRASAERASGSGSILAVELAKEAFKRRGDAHTCPKRDEGEPSNTVRTSYCRSFWLRRGITARDCPYLTVHCLSRQVAIRGGGNMGAGEDVDGAAAIAGHAR